MIKLTVLYSYDKAVAKLSKVYGTTKQAVKDHFDDMNVELFYQTRKAFGRDYTCYMIKQSDIEECRKWLDTHKDELVKVETSRNRGGYILDNRKDEPKHFNTQREIADFLGYKATGFVIGKVYRGYELKSGVPENNTILNTNTGKGITNHTIANDDTSNDTEVVKSEPEIQPLNTTVDSNDNSMCTQESSEENLNCNTEFKPNETIANDTTSSIEVAEIPLSDLETKVKSDFESKIDAFFDKYYGD